MKRLLISGAAALLVSIAVPATSRGELDLPYVQTEIANLQARTSNTEADVKQLQDAAQVAPGAHVDVPSQPPAQDQAAQPPTSENALSGSQTGEAAQGDTTPTPQPFVSSVQLIGLKHGLNNHSFAVIDYTCQWQTSPMMVTIQAFSVPDNGQQVTCTTTP